jgi:D-3-phosphoglycerate dehydrogenase
MMTNTFITYPDASSKLVELLSGERRKRLDALGEFTLYHGRSLRDEEYISRIDQAEGILLGQSISSEVLRQAPNLKVISFVGTGASSYIDLDEASKLGITVTNTPGYANDSVAEHAMALLFSAARKIVQTDREVRSGRWGEHDQVVELCGKTLGLVGFGGIGKRMAELASAIGMRVIAWTRHPERHDESCSIQTFMSLKEVLVQSDAVSLHLALTPSTEKVIGAREFDLMKEGVLFINTARGELVDEAALIQHLRNHRIAAAGLDVFHEEPLEPDHPLCELDNVILTPHSAFQTPKASGRLLDKAIYNLECFFSGRPDNVITD